MSVVKSEILDSVLKARYAIRNDGAVPTDADLAALRRAIDPRTIRPEHMDMRSADPAWPLHRVVRIVNVNTNHYMCHLPL